MSARDLFEAGRVDEALLTLQIEVRERPEDLNLRVFLFELLVIHGLWERAMGQLEVMTSMEPKAVAFSRLYQPVLKAEMSRKGFFKDDEVPVVFGEPEPWMAQVLHGNGLLAKGQPELAIKVLEQAFGASPRFQDRKSVV